MFEFIKKLFRKERNCACIGRWDDENAAACAMEAFKTGQMIIGTVDKNGELTMTHVPIER